MNKKKMSKFISHFESGNEFWVNIRDIEKIKADDLELLGASSLFVQLDEDVDFEPTLSERGKKIGEVLGKVAAKNTLQTPCLKGQKRSLSGLKKNETIEWEDFGFCGGEIDHQTMTKINDGVFLYTSLSY